MPKKYPDTIPTLREIFDEWNKRALVAIALGIGGVKVHTSLHETVADGIRKLAKLNEAIANEQLKVIARTDEVMLASTAHGDLVYHPPAA